MSITKGFGNLVAQTQNTYVLGLPAISNRNLIIQLSSKSDKQITDIVCGYTSIIGDVSRVLYGGRLIISQSKFDGDTLEIWARSNVLIDELASTNIILDVPITGDMPKHLNFSKPLYFGEGVDVSIILTYCATDGETEPASRACIASLNVQGFYGGSQKIFKELR